MDGSSLFFYCGIDFFSTRCCFLCVRLMFLDFYQKPYQNVFCLCHLIYFSYPIGSSVHHSVQVLQEADQDLTNTLPMGAVHSSGDDDEQV